MSDKIEGKTGFDEVKDKSGFITKEDTLFKVDGEGKAIPEKWPIYIYDRDLDMELIEESILLMQSIKRQNAISKVLIDLDLKQEKEINDLKDKIEKTTDGKIKSNLKLELVKLENVKGTEEIKTKININVTEDGIKDSRDIIKQLKEEKEKQKVKEFVELIPCTTSESYLAFEKGKTVEGKDTDDWIADLISKKIVKPKYTLEEAKRLKPDFKVSMKEGIMESSNYKVKNYRDIMMEQKLEQRPLIAKKD